MSWSLQSIAAEVRAGRRSEPISEIEIEIKDGEPVEAVRFARRIATETRATYGPKTKAERGYALCAGGRPSAGF